MSDARCDPGDCPVCIAAHTTGMHFAQNAASNSENDSSSNTSSEASHQHGYALTYKPTSQLKIFLSCSSS